MASRFLLGPDQLVPNLLRTVYMSLGLQGAVVCFVARRRPDRTNVGLGEHTDADLLSYGLALWPAGGAFACYQPSRNHVRLRYSVHGRPFRSRSNPRSRANERDYPVPILSRGRRGAVWVCVHLVGVLDRDPRYPLRNHVDHLGRADRRPSSRRSAGWRRRSGCVARDHAHLG